MTGCWGQCFGCAQASTSHCKHLTLLLIGINNAGKTTVLNSLKGDLHSETVPTYGFSSADIPAANCNFKVYDLGGGRNIRRIWTIYMSEVHGIIYVVDAADAASFAEARGALHQLLQAPQLAGKPVLVLANKQDLPHVQPTSDVAEALGLNQLQRERNVHRILSCRAKAAGQEQADPTLRQGLQWLLESISPVYAQLQAKIDKESAEAKAEEKQRQRDREIRAKQSMLERLACEKQQEHQAQQKLDNQQQQQSVPQHSTAHNQEGLLIKASWQSAQPAGITNLNTKQPSCSNTNPANPACNTGYEKAAALATAAATSQLPGAPEASTFAPDEDCFAQVMGSTADERCAACSCSESLSRLGLGTFSNSAQPAANDLPCPATTPSTSSLLEQDSAASSPDAEATSVTGPSISKQGGSSFPSNQASGPGRQLLGLLMQALPGSVAAGTPTIFSNLKQAAHDECGPTPRTYSISSDASSLFVSEPQHQLMQHRPSAQHSPHATAAGKGVASSGHINADRQSAAGPHGRIMRSASSPGNEPAAVDRSGAGRTLAYRSMSRGRSTQSNRVTPV